MLINHNKIHCFWCNKDYKIKDIYLDMEYEGSISCEKGHLVGNEQDKEWKELTGENDEQ